MRSLILLAALVQSLPAAAAPVAPTGKWIVDFDDAQCVASREYGQLQLGLKAAPIGEVVQVALISSGTYAPAQQLNAEIFLGDSAPVKTSGLLWSVGGKSGRRIHLVNLSVRDFARLEQAESVRIRIGNLESDLQLREMAALAKIMKSCVDDLQQVWASDTDGGVSARANLASYITDMDYPPSAIRNEQSGTTAFALLVDESGRVADCMVTQTSGAAVLDTQSCSTLKNRARFTPGTTAEGKPRKSRVLGRIQWKLP